MKKNLIAIALVVMGLSVCNLISIASNSTKRINSSVSVVELNNSKEYKLILDKKERKSRKSDNVKLKEVTVQGSRVPMTLNQAARMVTVLDTTFIKAVPAETVNDLLKYAIGVDVRQRGDMGIQTDIGIRGGTQDQIAILLNGINICDPQTGHLVMDIPVNVNEIERIEILEGPAGRVYGTSSLVGAVNIVTKVSSQDEVSVNVEGGSYGYFNGGMALNLVKGHWHNRVSGSYSRSDGYSHNAAGKLNSDFSASKAFYQGEYRGEDADIRWHFGLSDKGYGANTFYSPKFDDQYEHGFKTYSAIQAETKGKFHFKPAIYWNHSQDRFELCRGDQGDEKTKWKKFNYHRTNVYGIDLSSYFQTILGKTSFGANMRNEGIESTALGNPLSKPVHIHGTDRDYINGFNRTNISFFFEHNLVLNNFTASAGLTAVKNTANEMDFKYYPGVDVSYSFLNNFKLYGSWNTSLRMPSFTELSYSVGGHNADKNLKPEEMQSLEAGLKYYSRGIRAILSVYHHKGTNMIDWLKDLSEEDLSQGKEALWKSKNTSINTTGEEFSFRINFPELLNREDFFITNFFAGYSHISQDKELPKNMQSKYALEYLKHKFVSQVDFHIYKGLTANVSYRYQYRVGNYVKYNKKDGGKFDSTNVVPYHPYSLVDARLSWRVRNYKLYLQANNILNHTYYDHGNVAQPGFWFRAGLIWNISL